MPREGETLVIERPGEAVVEVSRDGNRMVLRCDSPFDAYVRRRGPRRQKAAISSAK